MASPKIGSKSNRSRTTIVNKSNKDLVKLLATIRPRDRVKVEKVLQLRGVNVEEVKTAQ